MSSSPKPGGGRGAVASLLAIIKPSTWLVEDSLVTAMDTMNRLLLGLIMGVIMLDKVG